jgi:hypothetical protein
MAHSNRLRTHWLLVVIEILLPSAAVVTAYLSQVGNWLWFTAISIFSILLYAIVKILDAFPQAKELVARDDVASKIAMSALPYGITQYFNMQSAKDQALRNKITQQAIENGKSLWLCANSGASYLDPSIYRHWSFIEKRLKSGVEFRVVILNPMSAEKGFRNQLNVNGEQFDSKVNVANLIKLHNTYPTLEIRFVRYGMHATVFATESCLFFDPYHVGLVEERIENRSFCLRIEPATPEEGVGLYRLFKSHFDTLWRAGVSLEEWAIELKERLPRELPEIAPRHLEVQYRNNHA